MVTLKSRLIGQMQYVMLTLNLGEIGGENQMIVCNFKISLYLGTDEMFKHNS
jgi:hypothetical protein